MTGRLTIQRTSDGFEVVRLAPVRVATFRDEADARLFVEAKRGNRLLRSVDGAPPLRGTVEPDGTVRMATAEGPAADDARYAEALEQVAAGEGCRAVADEMGMRFAVLRGLRANRYSQVVAARAAPGTAAAEAPPAAPEPAPAPAAPPAAAPGTAAGEEDYVRPPVRSALLGWTAEDDALVAAARDDELVAVAERLGRSVPVVAARRARLAAEVARDLGRAP